MTELTETMRRLDVLSFVVLAIGIVSGCGDPPPSTTLAPDKPMLDASKMSAADIAASKAKEHDGSRK